MVRLFIPEDDDQRVSGLRDKTIGGPVTVIDAKTGIVKKVILNPPSYYTLVLDRKNLRRRTKND
jgi:hypothetical protein